MRIRNNIPAICAWRVGKQNSGTLAKTLEKLASGYQINRAADDAAGLAISEKMRALIRGLNAAGNNTQDAISLLQTAEGGLQETHDLLNRMIELAEQSANGTYDNATDRAALEHEFEELCAEIDRIAQGTNFNGISLLKAKGAGAAANAGGRTGMDAAPAAAFLSGRSAAPASAGGADRAAVPTPAALTAADSAAPASEVAALLAAPRATGVTCGDFTVIGGSLNTDFEYDSTTHVLKILKDTAITITGTTTADSIVVAKDVAANITLHDVNIDQSGTGDYSNAGVAAFQIEDDSSANVSVTITGTNSLKSGYHCAGLQKNGGTSTGTLTIDGTGSLQVSGGRYGTGIGGGYQKEGSNITITGGTVTAKGSVGGAGIGGGYDGAGSNIKITGGTVTATGGSNGAGIGGGRAGNGSNITITGGTVTAKGSGSAGIGGGGIGAGSNITITGGTVTATGGVQSAGIGGGIGKDGSNIKITGGTVTATGGDLGAGIGGGWKGDGTGIVIDGGNVTAKSSNQEGGAGIGGGSRGTGEVTINGGNVTASANGGAGIGAGGCFDNYDAGDATVTINGGKVTASSDLSAGIGGGITTGSDTNTVNVTIKGGTVEATGNQYRPAIGGGINSSGKVEISGNDTVIIAKTTGSNPALGNDDNTTGNMTTEKKGGLIIENGTGKTYGDVTIKENVKIDSGATVTVDSGHTLTVDSGKTLTNNGTIVNDGTIKNNGTIDNKGTINNNGTITGSISGSSPLQDVGVTLNGASLTGNKDYTVTVGTSTTTATTDNSGKLELSLGYGSHTIKIDHDGDRYEGSVTVGGSPVSANLSRATVHGEIGLPSGVALTGNAEYTVKVNGAEQKITTDGSGKLVVKGLEKGREATISLVHDGKTYEGKATLNGDGTITLAEKSGPPDPPDPPDPPPTPGYDGTVVLPPDAPDFKPNTDYDVEIDGNKQTITTDKDGNLVIPSLPDGDHTIKIEHDGSIYEGNVTVNGGNVTITVDKGDPVVPPSGIGNIIRFQIGASAGETLDFIVRDMDCAGIGIDGLSVATQQQAADALDGIKSAINRVSSHRGYIGALQNRLEHTMNNIHNTTENITAAESRIRDADMAKEMMNYTKQTILVQAAQAMLAQANQLPQQVLQFLQP